MRCKVPQTRGGNIRVPNLKCMDQYDLENPHQWLDMRWEESLQN
jgi:hypothetical protein